MFCRRWADIVKRISWILGIIGEGTVSKPGLGPWTNSRCGYVLNNVRNGHSTPPDVSYLEKSRKDEHDQKPEGVLAQWVDYGSSIWERHYWRSMKSWGKQFFSVPLNTSREGCAARPRWWFLGYWNAIFLPAASNETWNSLLQDVLETRKCKWISKRIRQIKPDGPDAACDVGNQYPTDRRKLRGCWKARIIHTPS